jgi:hypothetical protein
MLETLQSAEAVYNPNKTPADLEVSVDRKSHKPRVSSKLSVEVGERTANKAMARMHDWRTSIMATERKRIRKSALDLQVFSPYWSPAVASYFFQAGASPTGSTSE